MQFNYEDYVKQQAEKKSAQPNTNKDLVKLRYVNEFLKNDGDSVVIRLPYNSMSDIQYETTHSVKFPDKQYPSRVRCEGKGCPLCAQGVKLDTRFFVKALVYAQNNETNKLDVVPAVWDRSSAFADIDIKELIQECKEEDMGLLSENLIKVKRNGVGLNTRYTCKLLLPTNTIYNSNTCSADFTILDNIDPTKVLTKSLEQYNAAVNPDIIPTNTIESNSSSNEAVVENSAKRDEVVEDTRRTLPQRYQF